MKKNSKNLIWIDLEMTGLDTFNDRVIEIATIVTDKDLHILEEYHYKIGGIYINYYKLKTIY